MYTQKIDKSLCCDDSRRSDYISVLFLATDRRLFMLLPWKERPTPSVTGGGQNENSQRHAEELEDKKCIHDPSCNNLEIAHDNNSSLQDEKKIPRNKVCPCGSKKKYKSCCGSAAGRSASRFAVNQTFDNGKVRKDKKQGKKGGPVAVKPQGSDGGLPDEVVYAAAMERETYSKCHWSLLCYFSHVTFIFLFAMIVLTINKQ
ncbi:unnamed protein product [Ilex paraguariensis]|uniref:Uncharacterized protein n=1 Tax=Ilex paraguariensis TaxID=185542 RepID=A0ABC8SQP9_9AQUA